MDPAASTKLSYLVGKSHDRRPNNERVPRITLAGHSPEFIYHKKILKFMYCYVSEGVFVSALKVIDAQERSPTQFCRCQK